MPAKALRTRSALILGALAIAVVLSFSIYLAVGSEAKPIGHVFAALFGRIEDNVIVGVRLPRALAALITGAMLGLVGSAFQAFFRNQLADPYIVGVSSGAAVGGAV